MHWITLLSITLVAAGTLLAIYGQNIRNRLDTVHLRQRISELTQQVDKLLCSDNELTTKLEELQKDLSEKDETIYLLKSRLHKQIEIDNEYQKNLSEKDETIRLFRHRFGKHYSVMD
ncbi:hypothetical protein SCALIN_C24_0047 [Candidatus Scalindua japonica]|uniref:Uncharacterized protein n=1 Tax=Candidatus Scalindua japonica TaxID=1284222 RepID=A0A286U0A3_9BACT|nr:hypothetical protein [Candidatus Scalindua japonica]GAX61548.1 hypothetical protein SCALIN_C24_0047 [Candidatus Scalindua japonica]